ncbi:MAG: hypothetical protein PHE54_02070 [Bacilli bacterium]|nr:hypothetical protein [Bacilli bacterium]
MNEDLKEYYEILCGNDYPDFIDKYLDLPEFERISHIGQFCGCDYTALFNIKFWYNRKNHSIVTALMTWHFTKDKKQALAALFHDLGTPVFSHCIDYVLGDYEQQESSEKDVYEIITSSQTILDYLIIDGVRVEDIKDINAFPIVENSKPKICVDRLDGVFMTCFVWCPIWNMNDIRKIYNDIIVLEENGIPEIGFKTKETAEKFFDGVFHYSIVLQQNEDKYAMMYIADVIKKAIHLGHIAFEDLYTKKESEIVAILQKNIPSWNTFTKVSHIVRTDEVPENYYVSFNAKKRYVVPLCLHNNKSVRLNQISSKCQKLLDEYLNYEDAKYAYAEEIVKIDEIISYAKEKRLIKD